LWFVVALWERRCWGEGIGNGLGEHGLEARATTARMAVPQRAFAPPNMELGRVLRLGLIGFVFSSCSERNIEVNPCGVTGCVALVVLGIGFVLHKKSDL